MTSSIDKITMDDAIALPDLTKIEVSDAFYLLRKIYPLDLMVSELHAPRKYYGKYERSKRTYEKSLAQADQQQIAWKDFILETAINMAFAEMERELNTIKSRCIANTLTLPHNLFSWSMKDTINRLDLPNDLYVDWVESNYQSVVLDEFKLQMDLTQILEIYNRIASEFMNNINLDNKLIPTLEEYRRLDEYQKKLSIQFNYNKNEHRKFLETYNRNLLFPPAKLKEELLPRLARLQFVNMQSEALIPIHDRYKVNLVRTNAYFKIFKNSKYLQNTRNEIDELNSVMTAEENNLKSKMTMYNTQLLNYMESYDGLVNKFDIDYEDADNEVAIIRSNINKAKEDLKFFKDQVVFFKKAVVETLQIIKREELEQQQKLDSIASMTPVKKRKSKPKKNKK